MPCLPDPRAGRRGQKLAGPTSPASTGCAELPGGRILLTFNAPRKKFRMARIRTIKPEFFRHEDLFELEMETKLPIRVAYAGLWTCCDREGRFKWRPRTLKTEILPYDDCDFSRVLDALVTRGFVVKYRVNDEDFGHVPSFCTHQVINNRESASTLPDPSLNELVDACPTREARVPDACPTPVKGKGKEGKENRKESARVVDALVLPDWLPRETWEDFVEHRKERKSAMTDRAKRIALRKLEELKQAGNDPKKVIEQSIFRNWEGFFELKSDKPAWQSNPQPAAAPKKPMLLDTRPLPESPSKFISMDEIRREIFEADDQAVAP
jgi:hypothetical protein